MRTVALVAGLVIVFALSPSGADAAHEATVCGQLLEYVRAPSNDIRHGYAHVRLATPTGDTGVLFHDTNPSKAPSRIQPGATRQGAQICISGPYVHILGSSPYVSPYDLRLAPTGSLPGTSTTPVADGTPVRVCGAMSEYRAATVAAPGAIVVAGERFAISSDALVTIAAGAVVPQRVCLEGTWVRSETVGRLLTQLAVRFCPEHSSNFPPGEGCSDVSGVLPGTSTGDGRAAAVGPLMVAIGGALLVAVLRRRTTTRQS